MKKTLKKVILGLLFSHQMAYTFDVKTAAKIYDKLFYGVFQKQFILVYTKNSEYKAMIENSQNLKLANTPEEAHIVLITSKSELTSYIKTKIVFATTNDVFVDCECAIGAFYWQKGRPEIVFSKERLENAKLSVLGELERYVK